MVPLFMSEQPGLLNHGNETVSAYNIANFVTDTKKNLVQIYRPCLQPYSSRWSFLTGPSQVGEGPVWTPPSILYVPFFIGLGVGQCEHTIVYTECQLWRLRYRTLIVLDWCKLHYRNVSIFTVGDANLNWPNCWTIWKRWTKCSAL